MVLVMIWRRFRECIKGLSFLPTLDRVSKYDFVLLNYSVGIFERLDSLWFKWPFWRPLNSRGGRYVSIGYVRLLKGRLDWTR